MEADENGQEEDQSEANQGDEKAGMVRPMSWLEKAAGELGGVIDEYEFFKAQRHPEPEATGWVKDVGEKVRDDSEAMPGPAAHSGPGGGLLQEVKPMPRDHPLYRKPRHGRR